MWSTHQEAGTWASLFWREDSSPFSSTSYGYIYSQLGFRLRLCHRSREVENLLIGEPSHWLEDPKSTFFQAWSSYVPICWHFWVQHHAWCVYRSDSSSSSSLIAPFITVLFFHSWLPHPFLYKSDILSNWTLFPCDGCALLFCFVCFVFVLISLVCFPCVSMARMVQSRELHTLEFIHIESLDSALVVECWEVWGLWPFIHRKSLDSTSVSRVVDSETMVPYRFLTASIWTQH